MKTSLPSTVDHAVDQPTGIGWAIWIVAAALPWLWPVHGEPWPVFYSEALAAAAMVPIGLWLVMRGQSKWALDRTVFAMLAIAPVPLIQAQFGLVVFEGEAWLVFLYIIACAAMALLARQAQVVDPWRLAEALFAALAVAALLSAGLTLYQWLEQDWLGILVHYRLVSGRAYANLGQPNNLATLLCWGVLALWWGYHRRKLSGAVAAAATGFLLLGVVLTRSRTGWLEVAILACSALYIRWRHRTGPQARSVVLLSAWFVVLAAGLEPVAHQVLRETPAALSNQTATGLRPAIWKVAIDEVTQQPLTGYGWNQGAPAYLSVVERHADVRRVINHAHNVLLDLLVWNGVPLGALIMVAFAWWARAQWQACRTQEQRLLLLALAIFVSHALLEFPHTYLFFLLPAAAMMGTLGAVTPRAPVLAISRWIGGTAVLGLGLVLGTTVLDYQAIERDLQSAKMREAGVHNPYPSPSPEPVVLGFLQTALQSLRTQPARDLSPRQLADMRRALDRYPLPWAMFRYATATALAGHPDEAKWALERLCLMDSADRCAQAMRDWHELVSQGHPELAVVTLPVSR